MGGALCSQHLATICDTCNSKTHFLRESICESKTICTPEVEFQESAGSGITDRVCSSVTICNMNQFETQQPTQIQDRRCQQRTQCDNTQYEKFRGTQTTDRICSRKVCSCTNGIGSIGSKCTHHSSPSCETCNDGFELDIETKSCTLKTCTCDNGIAATGMECPESNTLKCASCSQVGHHGDHCEPNEC